MNRPQLPEIKVKSSQNTVVSLSSCHSQSSQNMQLPIRSPLFHDDQSWFTSITDEITSLADDIGTSSAVKRKLKNIVSKITQTEQEIHPLHQVSGSNVASSPSSILSSSQSQACARPLETAFRDWLSGEVFISESGNKLTGSRVRSFADVSASGQSMSTVGVSQIFNRGTPATQNPTESFDAMNKLTMFSLSYVNVPELEFDIDRVKEMDGSLMEPSERLFLSVCCSIFANFTFVREVDLGKLVKFFSSLYEMYVKTNPFHNFLHAADSLQMLSLFFRDPCVNFCFTDEEILLSFLSVLALDVVHIGIHNSSLAAMDHNIVKIFGPETTVEHCSLLVFFRVLFSDENFFMLPMFPEAGVHTCSLTALIREKISSIVFHTAVSQRPALLHVLDCIGAAGTILHRDVLPLLSALVVLGTNGFMFRQRAECLRFAYSLRLEFLRESQEMASRKLFFFIPSTLLNNLAFFVADYGLAVVKTIVDSAWSLVPVDLRDNFLRNCEVANGEELEQMIKSKRSMSNCKEGSSNIGGGASSICISFSPFPTSTSPWDDNMTKVVEILQNASAFANSVNRKVSKMAILNATPPRRCSTMDISFAFSNAGDDRHSEGENSMVVGGGGPSGILEDNQSSFFSSCGPRVCKPEHCFLFLQLYDRYEMEDKSLKEFVGQLVFLATQLDPAYLSTESRSLFLDKDNPESAKYVALGMYILANEEAPSTAEHLVGGRSRPSTPLQQTNSLVLQLLDMYSRRETRRKRELGEAVGRSIEDEEQSGSAFRQSLSTPPPTDNLRKKTPPPIMRKRGDTPTFCSFNSPVHSLSDPSLFAKGRKSSERSSSSTKLKGLER